MGKNSDTCQDPDKIIFNFLSCDLNDHEKSVLCKSLNFVISPKAIGYSKFLLHFEILFIKITSFISNFNEDCVKSRLWDSAFSSFKQVCKISDKNLSLEEIKIKDLVIQKTDQGNNIVIFNRSDYISNYTRS